MSINALQQTAVRFVVLLLMVFLSAACKKKEDVTDLPDGSLPDNIEVEELPMVYYVGGEYDLVANVSDVVWTLEPASAGLLYSDGGVSHLTLLESGPFTLTGVSGQLSDTLRISDTSVAWTLLVDQDAQWQPLSEVSVPAGGTLHCSLGVKDAGGQVTHLDVGARWIAVYEGGKPYTEPHTWEGGQLTLEGVSTTTPWTLSAVFGVKREAVTVQ